MLDILYFSRVTKLVYFMELRVADQPSLVRVIACVEQTNETMVLKQLLELKPTDNQFKELSRHHHPFTQAGSVTQRQADYDQAFQEIQDWLNSQLMMAAA